MSQDNREVLNEIIKEFEENKKNAQRCLNQNLDRISEVNVNLKTLLDTENNHDNYFSPRNTESFHNEKISALTNEKSILDEENRKYYSNINKLNHILGKLYNYQNEEKNFVSRKNDEELNYFNLLEADRQRIAKDLHDSALQNLTAIIHKVELASMYISQDPIRAKLELSTISNSIKETINEIRETIFDLRPMTFDDLGFRELLDAYIKKEVENCDIQVCIDKFCLTIEDQYVLLFIFRVIRECLGNSVKHSNCSEIHLIIDDSNDKMLYLNISDNGTGFNIEEKKLEKDKHFGLNILKERVKLMQGTIKIVSGEDGTKVDIYVPINYI